MHKLTSELQRLYFLPGQRWLSQEDDGRESLHAAGTESGPEALASAWSGERRLAFNLVSPDGMARAMLINVKMTRYWAEVAKLYQALQTDLDLPAPAVSVSGDEGYGLWFSLAEPVPVAQAGAFLDALRQRYLADLPAAALVLSPASASGQGMTNLLPSLHRASGKWSAYIDPSLGSMFIDEPWLEMAPNRDKQADMLAGLECIRADLFQNALAFFQRQATSEADASPSVEPINAGYGETQPRSKGSRLNFNKQYSDPKSFLLAVMNDPSATAAQRIKAAKALLPYFAQAAS